MLPSLLVEKTLSLAFEVTNRASQDKWIEFLDSVSLLQIVNGAADRPHARASEAGGAPVVDGRLVTTGMANDDLAELEVFDAAVGSVVNESCAA